MGQAGKLHAECFSAVLPYTDAPQLMQASRKCPPEPPSYLKVAQAASTEDPDTFQDPRHSMYYQPSRSDDGESDDDI
jgi:hypothetical protein